MHEGVCFLCYAGPPPLIVSKKLIWITGLHRLKPCKKRSVYCIATSKTIQEENDLFLALLKYH